LFPTFHYHIVPRSIRSIVVHVTFGSPPPLYLSALPHWFATPHAPPLHHYTCTTLLDPGLVHVYLDSPAFRLVHGSLQFTPLCYHVWIVWTTTSPSTFLIVYKFSAPRSFRFTFLPRYTFAFVPRLFAFTFADSRLFHVRYVARFTPRFTLFVYVTLRLFVCCCCSFLTIPYRCSYIHTHCSRSLFLVVAFVPFISFRSFVTFPFLTFHVTATCFTPSPVPAGCCTGLHCTTWVLHTTLHTARSWFCGSCIFVLHAFGFRVPRLLRSVCSFYTRLLHGSRILDLLRSASSSLRTPAHCTFTFARSFSTCTPGSVLCAFAGSPRAPLRTAATHAAHTHTLHTVYLRSATPRSLHTTASLCRTPLLQHSLHALRFASFAHGWVPHHPRSHLPTVCRSHTPVHTVPLPPTCTTFALHYAFSFTLPTTLLPLPLVLPTTCHTGYLMHSHTTTCTHGCHSLLTTGFLGFLGFFAHGFTPPPSLTPLDSHTSSRSSPHVLVHTSFAFVLRSLRYHHTFTSFHIVSGSHVLVVPATTSPRLHHWVHTAPAHLTWVLHTYSHHCHHVPIPRWIPHHASFHASSCAGLCCILDYLSLCTGFVLHHHHLCYTAIHWFTSFTTLPLPYVHVLGSATVWFSAAFSPQFCRLFTFFLVLTPPAFHRTFSSATFFTFLGLVRFTYFLVSSPRFTTCTTSLYCLPLPHLVLGSCCWFIFCTAPALHSSSLHCHACHGFWFTPASLTSVPLWHTSPLFVTTSAVRSAWVLHSSRLHSGSSPLTCTPLLWILVHTTACLSHYTYTCLSHLGSPHLFTWFLPGSSSPLHLPLTSAFSCLQLSPPPPGSLPATWISATGFSPVPLGFLPRFTAILLTASAPLGSHTSTASHTALPLVCTQVPPSSPLTTARSHLPLLSFLTCHCTTALPHLPATPAAVPCLPPHVSGLHRFFLVCLPACHTLPASASAPHAWILFCHLPLDLPLSSTTTHHTYFWFWVFWILVYVPFFLCTPHHVGLFPSLFGFAHRFPCTFTLPLLLTTSLPPPFLTFSCCTPHVSCLYLSAWFTHRLLFSAHHLLCLHCFTTTVPPALSFLTGFCMPGVPRSFTATFRPVTTPVLLPAPGFLRAHLAPACLSRLPTCRCLHSSPGFGPPLGPLPACAASLHHMLGLAIVCRFTPLPACHLPARYTATTTAALTTLASALDSGGFWDPFALHLASPHTTLGSAPAPLPACHLCHCRHLDYTGS